MAGKTSAALILFVAAAVSLTGCVHMVAVPAAPDSRPGAPSASASPSTRQDCAGRSLTLTQPRTRYQLSGTCDTISIQGQDITVVLDRAKALTINGDRTRVTVNALGALSIQGQDNTVSAAEIGALVISGDRNSVSATTLGAQTVSGQQNSVQASPAG